MVFRSLLHKENTLCLWMSGTDIENITSLIVITGHQTFKTKMNCVTIFLIMFIFYYYFCIKLWRLRFYIVLLTIFQSIKKKNPCFVLYSMSLSSLPYTCPVPCLLPAVPNPNYPQVVQLISTRLSALKASNINHLCPVLHPGLLLLGWLTRFTVCHLNSFAFMNCLLVRTDSCRAN